MTAEEGRIVMAKLARLRSRKAELTAEVAELDAQEAKLFEQLAGAAVTDSGKVMGRTRRCQSRREPQLQPVSELDQARARQALRENAVRRKVDA